ncbi:MAG TPA: hypothetical protein PLK24_03370 [Atribacter sp.]|uniref:hypothetical protein n=1 Tax=Atribacter sp. TaxID=2847780 RepID=UPI002D04880E|nr:hypothetical protein [Atribacter sp.]HQK82959.1 hypothetical protein [Atribacter sp.]
MDRSDGNDIPLDHLIADLRIICNNKIVRTISEWDPTSYRILQEPIDELIISDLIGGPWTVSELSEKYGIERDEIDDILHIMRKNQDLLEFGYVARRVGWNSSPGHNRDVRYSLIPIPFEARIYDLFLGNSLLDWHSDILSETNVVPVDRGEFTAILQKLCEIWQMPLTKVMESLEEKDSHSVQSIYGPIPFSTDPQNYENIRDTLSEDPNLLRFSFTNLNFQNFINDVKTLNRRKIMSLSVFDIQRYVIMLHDAIVYCSHFGQTDFLKKLLTQKRRLFTLLFPKPTQQR